MKKSPLFPENMCYNKVAKIPLPQEENPAKQDSFLWIFARNCEGTEQLRIF